MSAAQGGSGYVVCVRTCVWSPATGAVCALPAAAAAAAHISSCLLFVPSLIVPSCPPPLHSPRRPSRACQTCATASLCASCCQPSSSGSTRGERGLGGGVVRCRGCGDGCEGLKGGGLRHACSACLVGVFTPARYQVLSSSACALSHTTCVPSADASPPFHPPPQVCQG